MKYALFSETGRPLAFFMPEILGPLVGPDGTRNEGYPDNVVEISDATWGEFLGHPGARKWDGKMAVAIPLQPPSAESLPAVSRRQFAQALAEPHGGFKLISWEEAEAFGTGSTLPAPLADALIDAGLGEDDLARTRMFLLSAGTFERTHPKTVALGEVLGWTAEQLNNLWKYAGTL